jgi:hypothetical protein
MKKLLVFAMVLVSVVSYGQNKTSLGFMGGIGLNSTISANYGVWVDVGKWGGSFTNGAELSNEDPTDYIYGKVSKYTAGSSYYNIGVHRSGLFNEESIFLGGGIQRITDISTNGYEKAQTLPYVNLGIKKEIFYGNVRAEIVLAKIPSIGIGWGFNF